jgi:hypothetical protein
MVEKMEVSVGYLSLTETSEYPNHQRIIQFIEQG